MESIKLVRIACHFRLRQRGDRSQRSPTAAAEDCATLGNPALIIPNINSIKLNSTLKI
ncbi:hypothetical protein [Laspinema olomoucense]|uniref:Uncharacterized protein n=1 Tax=Laspinema olomoucense D3b TaxID=2953688 RepID=A0ABT2N7N3_9CYAN|nr:hypothetical protein [Laspinema sp. D3b]MCT7978701.1 hypothetical protein [Laspinema sp. D3b]